MESDEDFTPTDALMETENDGTSDGSQSKRRRVKTKRSADEESSLFDMIANGEVIPAADRMKKLYEENSEKGLVSIINSVFECCGFKSGSYVPDDLFGVNEESLLGDVENLKNSWAMPTEAFPLVKKEKSFKVFVESFPLVWKSFISTISSDILFDIKFMDEFLLWIPVFTLSKVRAIRHTFTTAAYGVLGGLIEKYNALQSNLSRTVNQARALKRKKKEEPGLNERAEELRKGVAKLDDLILHIFGKVFKHRYRDVDLTIRVLSVKYLIMWILDLPVMFLQDQYLKYLAWLLNDKKPQVRDAVLAGFLEIYTENDLTSLELLTQRYKSRFIEMTRDKDNRVVVSAVKIASLLNAHGYLTDDDSQGILKLLEDNAVRIQASSAEYFRVAFLEEIEKDKEKSTERRKEEVIDTVVEYIGAGAIPNLIRHQRNKVKTFKDYSLLVSLLVARDDSVGNVAKLGTILAETCKLAEEEDKESMTQKIFGEFPQLLMKYSTADALLSIFFEIPACFDISSVEDDNRGMQALIDALEHIFITSGSKQVMGGVLDVFLVLIGSGPGPSTLAREKLNSIMIDVYSKLASLLENTSVSISNEGLADAIHSNLAKLEAVSERYDVTFVDVEVHAKQIVSNFASGDNIRSDVVASAIYIAFHSIFWRMKGAGESSFVEDDIIPFWVERMLSLLGDLNAVREVKIAAIECVVNLYLLGYASSETVTAAETVFEMILVDLLKRYSHYESDYMLSLIKPISLFAVRDRDALRLNSLVLLSSVISYSMQLGEPLSFARAFFNKLIDTRVDIVAVLTSFFEYLLKGKETSKELEYAAVKLSNSYFLGKPSRAPLTIALLSNLMSLCTQSKKLAKAFSSLSVLTQRFSKETVAKLEEELYKEENAIILSAWRERDESTSLSEKDDDSESEEDANDEKDIEESITKRYKRMKLGSVTRQGTEKSDIYFEEDSEISEGDEGVEEEEE